jgi:hypothetical protein
MLRQYRRDARADGAYPSFPFHFATHRIQYSIQMPPGGFASMA